MNDSAPRRVLLVAAEETLRVAIGRMLRGCGHEVELARDARDALRHARALDFDLVLIFYRLPGLDGPSLHHALRVHAPSLARRVAFISRLDPDAPPLRSFQERSGCRVIQWPFDIHRLDRFVREQHPGQFRPTHSA